MSPSSDAFGITMSPQTTSSTITQPTPRSVLDDPTPTMAAEERFDSPQEQGRQSVTPTGRRPSESSPRAIDKPLPEYPSSPSVSMPSSRSESKFGTMHRRQPADNFDEDSRNDARRAAPSPRRPATMSFSDDVAGIFDTIGQSEPAKELGLPPDSLRIRERTGSGDIPASRNRFPADLGRSTSVDSPMRGQKLTVPAPVAQRTSSLPSGGSPRLDGTSSIPQRSPSSPGPSPRPLDDALIPPASVSRSSSTSSRRRTKTDNGAYPSLIPPNLGSPLRIGDSDFAPVKGFDSATLRAKKEPELPPLSPASVRLVTTPQLNRVNGSGFSANGDQSAKPWGRSSPTPRVPSGGTDSVEIVKTPTGSRRGRNGEDDEDDEERGRRLACEFLDNDFSSMQSDKVAEFIGGP